MIRFKRNILCTIFLLAFAGNVQAGSFFKAFEGKTAPSSGKQVLVPEQYRVFSAEQSKLIAFLTNVPADAAHPALLSLPKPDGTSMDFYIWKTPVMEEPLQSRYTTIQTFTAVAKENKSITAKIDFTVKGFHAMIFDGSNTFMIDPYADVADGYYSVYYKKDYTREAGQMMTCEMDDKSQITDAAGNAPESLDGGLAMKQYGSTKKTFRLALSCTGEYAAAVSGGTPTTASVLAAMVTSMNRVNGIYERELGVTMILIGNNDQLIYLNPLTDPFTANNNGPTLLGQNQSNTASVIGNTNYDIGHIFSTGGGGIAFLASVCGSNVKARGVTGSPNPVGDAYDVDYVAHEMGHQFAAQHTFNAAAGACNNNTNPSTAYEPGSGSTIMAYAGICGAINNLQAHSDAYFHSISLDQISDFLVNEANCAVDDPNGAPAITLPSITHVYTIPYRTPFELIGPVATADPSDTINYCWEQWDLGNFEEDENGSANFTDGPSFRSFLPSFNRVRVFPRIDSLVKNVTAYRGERLPSVARTLTFRLTARNVFNGFGAFDLSDDVVTLNVIDTAGPFEVTSPNLPGDTFYVNEPAQITWNVAQTDVAPVSTPDVDIYLSVDGGFTYPYTLATGVPNTGSATVTVPDTVTNKARIKVKGAGNVFFDISNVNFRIVDSTDTVMYVQDIQLDSEISVFPNPATNQIHLINKGQTRLAFVLFNTLGQKVQEGKILKQLSIPVSGYARGLYYLQLSDDQKGSKTTRRITLQ